MGSILSIYISMEKVMRKGQENLKVTIEDDGASFPDEVIKGERKINSQNGHGVGLYNVDKTMEIMYGDSDLIQYENLSRGTRITIYFLQKPVI